MRYIHKSLNDIFDWYFFHKIIHVCLHYIWTNYAAPALYDDADMDYTMFLLDPLEVLLKSHVTGLLNQQYLTVINRIPS